MQAALDAALTARTRMDDAILLATQRLLQHPTTSTKLLNLLSLSKPSLPLNNEAAMGLGRLGSLQLAGATAATAVDQGQVARRMAHTIHAAAAHRTAAIQDASLERMHSEGESDQQPHSLLGGKLWRPDLGSGSSATSSGSSSGTSTGPVNLDFLNPALFMSEPTASLNYNMVQSLAKLVVSEPLEQRPRPGVPLVDDWDCLRGMVDHWQLACGPMGEYGMRHTRTFANLCNAGVVPLQLFVVLADGEEGAVCHGQRP